MNFFEATSKLFNNIAEYFKIFIAEILLSVIIGLFMYVPFLGWIIALFISYISLFILPLGIYKVSYENRIDISDLLKESYNLAIHPMNITKEILKLVVVGVGFIICLTCFISAVFIALFTAGINTEIIPLFVFVNLLFMICICILFSLATQKFYLNLEYKIAAGLFGEKKSMYGEKNSNKYKYDFLWCFIPIINIWAKYAILIRFIDDCKTDDVDEGKKIA